MKYRVYWTMGGTAEVEAPSASAAEHAVTQKFIHWAGFGTDLDGIEVDSVDIDATSTEAIESEPTEAGTR